MYVTELSDYEFYELDTDELPCDGGLHPSSECSNPAKWYGQSNVFGIVQRILLCDACRESPVTVTSKWFGGGDN